MTQILIDSGPLAAYFCETDQWFEWIRATLRAFPPPLVTCEAILSESAFLIGRESGEPGVLLQMLSSGQMKVGFDVQEDVNNLAVLMKRYRDTPISLADACMIRMTEIYADCLLITTDRDFLVYRRFGRQVIPLIAPWQD